MAYISSSSFSDLSHDLDGPDLKHIRELVTSVNNHILELTARTEYWNSVKSKCTSKFCVHTQEFFEFSEHSVLSNLYWGIEGIEAALQAEFPEEKEAQLRKSEGLLQVPALLDEHGVTAGISNDFLVCFSYFYLSVVKKLQNDEWQVVLHFLQATMSCPRFVLEELVVELCEPLFPSRTVSEIEAVSGLPGGPFMKNERKTDEAIRQAARRYKHWLMYYHVMLHGDTSRHCRTRDPLTLGDESRHIWRTMSGTGDSSRSIKQELCLQTHHTYEMGHPVDPQEHTIGHTADKPKACRGGRELQDHSKIVKQLDPAPDSKIQNKKLEKYTSKRIKTLQDVLLESESDAPTSRDSLCSYNLEESDKEEFVLKELKSQNDLLAYRKNEVSFKRSTKTAGDDVEPKVSDQNLNGPSNLEATSTALLPNASRYPGEEAANDANLINLFSSICNLDLSILEVKDRQSDTMLNIHVERNSSWKRPQPNRGYQIAPTALQNCTCTPMDYQRKATTKTQMSSSQRRSNDFSAANRKDSKAELMEILEKAISKLCCSDGLAKFGEDYAVEFMTIYEMLNNKKGEKFSMLQDVILDQLLTAISTSKEDRVIRASLSILTTMLSLNESAVEDIKKKGLRLCDLATALKRNVHEAAILIYLINPSPMEIMTLELLPALVEVVCTSSSYKGKSVSFPLTPPAASLMIIEVLVTAFDCTTNNMHLAAITSPHVLCGLLDVAKSNDQLEEYIALANILVKCMQFDGQCRKHVSQFIPVGPFICLLRSEEEHAKFAALEFFHEILLIPRSSAISLLQQIRKEGSTSIMHELMQCVQQLQPDYQILASNLLLQLDLLENSDGKSVFTEEAMHIIIKSVACEERSKLQQLSTFILANLGGTYSWTGEPYTVAWLVRKTGLTSLYHWNMIRNFDWREQNLQDAAIDSWCSKIAKIIIGIGIPFFQALLKGLRSKIKRVSRDSLTAIAWIGCEISKHPIGLRHSACEILLNEIEQFLHPGVELEERLLACLCIYNYASGKGMQKLMHFSEGVRESLRRFSTVTWMAEELHRVADYYLPNKSRISCVHTQILEAKHSSSGAVTALIYYRGLLFSGHSDGSLKVWEIKQQSASILWDIKEHKKAVTCFSLYEDGESLLSGSLDKNIRVWKIVQKKLECIEVIAAKEPIQKIETYGQMIFIITQGHRIKVLDSSRAVKDICKNRKAKCMNVVQGKVYIGCTDSSIQELAIAHNREREIKAPTKSWMMHSKPINSIAVHRDWLYSAGSTVEGSTIKEWRTQCKPQMSIAATDRGRSVLAMAVVEDFIYLNCSLSTSSLQIWLRGTQQTVGRISAGSRITSILTANDTVLCGTEKGLIKGWIPL